MNKFKVLKFGKCYLNKEGDFVVALMRGDMEHGYEWAASHANPAIVSGKIYTRSRVVPNDGNWSEISDDMFRVAAAVHSTGHVVILPVYKDQLPMLKKKY